MKYFFVCSLFLIFINSVTASEKKSLTFGTFPIPQYVQNSTSGEFIKLMKEISKRAGVKPTFQLYPPKRSLQYFGAKKFDGFFPSLEIYLKQIPFKAKTTIPFYVKRDHIISLKENSSIDIKGKRLCLTSGYPYDEDYIKKHKLVVSYSKSDDACLRMLILKRSDVFLGELATAVHAILQLEKAHWSDFSIRQSFVSETPVYIAFKNDKKGEQLSQKFSSIIEELKNDGYYDNLFKDTKEQIRKMFNLDFSPY